MFGHVLEANYLCIYKCKGSRIANGSRQTQIEFKRKEQSPDGLSGSAPFFSPVFPLDRNISRLKILRCVGGSIPQPGAMPNLWIWSLQVLSPLCWVFQLMSSLLGPGNLLSP